MPRNDAGQVVCLNGHGPIPEERPPHSDGYGLYSMRHDPQRLGMVTQTSILFSVRLYVCGTCGYVEMYNEKGPPSDGEVYLEESSSSKDEEDDSSKIRSLVPSDPSDD